MEAAGLAISSDVPITFAGRLQYDRAWMLTQDGQDLVLSLGMVLDLAAAGPVGPWVAS